jgi:nicotinamidase-related amidase
LPIDQYTLLDPRHTALLMMECQEGIVGGSGKLGMLSEAVARHGIIERIAGLLRVARHAKVPVVHCTMSRRPDGGGAAANCLLLAATARRGMGLTPGTPQHAVVAPLTPADGDFVVTRFHGLSPFHGTELDAILRNLGVRTVVATGVSVNIGITGLTLEAVNAGYQVVIPRDAVTGTPDEFVEAMFEHTLRLLATVTSSEAVAQVWASPRPAAEHVLDPGASPRPQPASSASSPSRPDRSTP